MTMKKLEECARAVVPHICRATQDCDSEQDARDLRQAREIARAVIRCLMDVDENMRTAAIRQSGVLTDTDGTFRAMLQFVLDEAQE